MDIFYDGLYFFIFKTHRVSNLKMNELLLQRKREMEMISNQNMKKQKTTEEQKKELQKKADTEFDFSMFISNSNSFRQPVLLKSASGQLLHAVYFAATNLQFQKEKNGMETPLINRSIKVARLLQCSGNVTDENILIAAILYQTEQTFTAIRIDTLFGEHVSKYVKDVSLLQHFSKSEQLESIQKCTDGVKLIKMAIEIVSLWDILSAPKEEWILERIRGHVCWCKQVMLAAQSVNVEPYTGIFKILESLFKRQVASPLPEFEFQTCPLIPSTSAEEATCLIHFYAFCEKENQ